MRRILGTLWVVGLLMILAAPSWSVDSKQVDSVVQRAYQIHRETAGALEKKLNAALDYLRGQEIVREARIVYDNLWVLFQDKEDREASELLMLMGEQTLGGPAAPALPRLSALPALGFWGLLSGAPYLGRGGPGMRAVIFDQLADDLNYFSDRPVYQRIADITNAHNVATTLAINDDMTLEAFANFAQAQLGGAPTNCFVFIRAHGGIDGNNKFSLCTRPWYSSYPAAPTQTGVTRGSCRSYSPTGTYRGIKYCYAFNDQYCENYMTPPAYWDPQVMFGNTRILLLSCHSAADAALDDMPEWFKNHGALSWVGWSNSVSVAGGDVAAIDWTRWYFDDFDPGHATAYLEAEGFVPDRYAYNAVMRCRPSDSNGNQIPVPNYAVQSRIVWRGEVRRASDGNNITISPALPTNGTILVSAQNGPAVCAAAVSNQPNGFQLSLRDNKGQPVSNAWIQWVAITGDFGLRLTHGVLRASDGDLIPLNRVYTSSMTPAVLVNAQVGGQAVFASATLATKLFNYDALRLRLKNSQGQPVNNAWVQYLVAYADSTMRPIEGPNYQAGAMALSSHSGQITFPRSFPRPPVILTSVVMPESNPTALAACAINNAATGARFSVVGPTGANLTGASLRWFAITQ